MMTKQEAWAEYAGVDLPLHGIIQRDAFDAGWDAALKTDQKPVGFMCCGVFYDLSDVDRECKREHTLVYRHPARTLSDEEIELIWNMTEFHGGDDWNAALEFARAVLKEVSK